MTIWTFLDVHGTIFINYDDVNNGSRDVINHSRDVMNWFPARDRVSRG